MTEAANKRIAERIADVVAPLLQQGAGAPPAPATAKGAKGQDNPFEIRPARR